MRTEAELERVAFREKLTADEDVLLVDMFERRAGEERDDRKKASHLKQAAFFAARVIATLVQTISRDAATLGCG